MATAIRGSQKHQQYNESSLQSAIECVKSKNLSIRQASIKYGVPRSTLQDKLHGRHTKNKVGPDPFLSFQEEDRIVKWLSDLVKCGFPQKVDDLLNVVQKIVLADKRKTPFKNGRPGKTWYAAFLKRHPELVLRTPEGLTKGRAYVTEERIRCWFDDLKKFLMEVNCIDILDDPTRIFNGDETSFSMCPKTGKVLAPKGCKNVYNLQMGNEKETITVLLVFSASGETAPPMVVFPYIRVPRDVAFSVPDKWILGKSESGWMRSDTFFEYIANGFATFINENKIKKPILLLVDGHKSHLSFELSEFCDSNGIILYALPPNTTHMMQPADVSVFKGLKSDWKKTVRDWQINSKNCDTSLNKSQFCPLLESVLKKRNLPEIIKNGFRACGIYPFNPDAVDYSKCIRDQIESLELENKSVQNDRRIQPSCHDFEIAHDVIKFLEPKLKQLGELNVDLIIAEINAGKMSIQKTDIAAPVEEEQVVTDIDVIPSKDRLSTGTDLNHTWTDVFYDVDIAHEIGNCTYNIGDTILLDTLEGNVESNNEVAPRNDIANSCLMSPISNQDKDETQTFSFEQHLYYPKNFKPKRTDKQGIPAPSSISSQAWRNYYLDKEKVKKDKEVAILIRKEQRLKNQSTRSKKNNKKPKSLESFEKELSFKPLKEKCASCNEELISDIEDDTLKNIGCDICPKWYHLKCTKFKGCRYDDILNLEYICNNF